jgi:hypothetical protein
MDKIISEANEYPMIRFYVNPENSTLQVTLNNNVVITDEYQLGLLYIQAHLDQKFSMGDFNGLSEQ